MTLADYLSPRELFELTGRKQRPAQFEWLRRERWRFTKDADGNPRVLRSYRDKRLLDDAVEVERQTTLPDFRAIARGV